MDQPIIKQIIRLIAVTLSGLRDEAVDAAISPIIDFLKSYNHAISKDLIDKILSDYKRQLSEKIHTTDQLINEVLQETKRKLGYKDQLQFFVVLLDITNNFSAIAKFIPVETIAKEFEISEEDYIRYKHFLSAEDPASGNTPGLLVFSSRNADQTEELEGSWVKDKIQQRPEDEYNLDIDNFTGQLLVMYIKPIRSFIVRCINNELIEVDGIKLNECRLKIIEAGSNITYNNKTILTYNDIKQHYIQQNTKQIISLSVNDIQYKPLRTGNPIQSLTANEQTGSLIGILGKEGSGKTTLLKLLSGQIAPAKGNIEINGYDLQKNRYLLKDIIGYVPEEDLLFEELSVFDNLLINARLYYSSLSGHEIRQKIDQLLSVLSLTDIRDKVVGNMMNKKIQPGQRRILNIALELLREPQLLLVDNALSGLSMSDSVKVIKVLHNYTLEGNLVITSVSQVGGNMFSYFDDIWILDDGGYPVYTGPTHKLTGYLSKHLDYVEQYPETVDPATIIDLINHQEPGDDSVIQRAISPQAWHHLYLASVKAEQPEPSRKSILPTRPIKIPNLEIQFLIFSFRNFKCKFSRINNLVYIMLSGPVIALILGFFLRQPQSGPSSFSMNPNIPAYQYISIIIALFMGVALSAGEILKERNILQKEQYLGFSRFSYINSKIVFLLLITGIQSLLFIFIGNAILGIKGMIWSYWIVIYSVACFGVLTGLLFSSSARKLSTVYEILVPVFLAIQILFGGGLISYHNLNLSKTKYVPLIGELMVSRWGYEALAVRQFSANLYQKSFLAVDKNINRSNYYAYHLLPELEKITDKCSSMNPGNDSLSVLMHIVYNELNAIVNESDVFPFEFLDALDKPEISQELLTETHDYLTWLRLHFYERHENYQIQKNELTQHLIDSMGQEGFNRLKLDHYNEKLEKVVTNSDYHDQIELIGDRLVRFRNGIYQAPESNYGRAVMFVPSKIFNGQEINTFWFNISIIWMFSTLIYLMLLTNAVNYFRDRVFSLRA